MITIKLFASLKNIAGKDEVKIPVEGEISLKELEEKLSSQEPKIADHLRMSGVLVAVNQEVVSSNTKIKDGDEVAYLPSFSGG